MWSDFSGKAYTREQFKARVATLNWSSWRPKGITIHNTAAPTLAQWVEEGPNHQARIKNLQNYYEKLGWHGGPHWFISRHWLNEFSNPLRRGTHSPSFNATHLGIEMVGDFEREPFNSGDGALVRNNTIFAAAVLCKRLGLDPDKDIVLHREDPKTDHACPGKFVSKPTLIKQIKEVMAGKDVDSIPTIVDGIPSPPPKWKAPDHDAFKDAPATSKKFTNITATVFSGPDDKMSSGKGAYGILDHNKPGVALPYRFKGERPKVRVYYEGKSVVCDVVDVGPWNIDDPYWQTGTRPQAETGTDKFKGRKTNLAGIDLTPAAAKAIGLAGKGKVDWEFVGAVPATTPAKPAEPAKDAGKVAGGAVIGGVAAGTAAATQSGWGVMEWMIAVGVVVVVAVAAYFAWKWWREREPGPTELKRAELQEIGVLPPETWPRVSPDTPARGASEPMPILETTPWPKPTPRATVAKRKAKAAKPKAKAKRRAF